MSRYSRARSDGVVFFFLDTFGIFFELEDLCQGYLCLSIGLFDVINARKYIG